MKRQISVFLIGAAILAGTGVAAYAQGTQGPPSSVGAAGGPIVAQGSYLNICVSETNESVQYVEEHTTETGNCLAGYFQYTVPVDPAHIPINGTSTATTTDVVTVNSVSPDPLDESTGTFSYQMVAASSKGYAISTWNLSGQPSCVTIGTTTGLIQGSGCTSGTFDITVTAVDTNGVAGSTEFELVVS